MNKGGRPEISNIKTIQKLKEAFMLDCSVLEACCYANISKSTYYNKLSNNKEFMDEIEVSKRYLELKSRQVIAKSIEGGDIKVSMWYLERKKRSEFSINFIDEIKEKDATIESPIGKRLREMGYYDKNQSKS